MSALVVPQHTALAMVINQTNVWLSLPSTPLTEGPRMAWSVKKSASSEPNTCKITLSNLAPSSVAAITDLVRKRIEWGIGELVMLRLAGASLAPAEITHTNLGIASVRLKVGYVGLPLWLMFAGQSTRIETDADNPETTLTLICQDHGDSIGAGQIMPPKTYVVGTPIAKLVADLIAAMGLSVDLVTLPARLAAAATKLGLVVASTTQLLAPYVSAGSARAQLDAIFNALQLTWMVQDGILWILLPDETLPGYPPLVLKPIDGTLLRSPRRVEEGAYEVDTLLRPGLLPGRLVQVASTELGSKAFRLATLEAEGDTETGASVKLRLEELQTIPGLF